MPTLCYSKKMTPYASGCCFTQMVGILYIYGVSYVGLKYVYH